jgi:hypothetical protein
VQAVSTIFRTKRYRGEIARYFVSSRIEGICHEYSISGLEGVVKGSLFDDTRVRKEEGC